ncbi:hypothetical protein [Burkholderia sp. JKS000303]|uniref:hypothetical protein n=1 Tax=Burkholderia sp. JKS000303 TaxID=1938747 RepID=UPI000BF5956A|nr:hypothetical protein [Burkholderia sp. JKS000303]PFH29098.1 hypothetical protein BX604_2870 [Burkholderia sp. JKS000303]
MKVQIKGFIFAERLHNTSLMFSFAQYDVTKYDEKVVMVAPHEFEVEVPDDLDLRVGIVANLERKKKELQAEFNARVTDINAQIQSLLAIENGATS